MMDSAEKLGKMFESTIFAALDYVHSRINEAYAEGWKPPENWVVKLAGTACPPGEDTDVWMGALFTQFCNETSFPEGWTLEKLVVFNQLLFKGSRP